MRKVKNLGLGLGIVWLLAACAHTRTVQQSAIKSDSTNVSQKEKVTRTDSTSLVQTLKEKTLPGSKVDVPLTNCDSIRAALQAMPSGIPDTIIVTDPKSQTKLKFYLDANKQLRAQAETADRKYNEITIEKNRTIQNLTEISKEKDREIKELKDQVREHEQSFLAKAARFFKDSIWTIIILVASAVIVFVYRKIKVGIVR